MSSAPPTLAENLARTAPPGRLRMRRLRILLLVIVACVVGGVLYWWSPWANRQAPAGDTGTTHWRLAQQALDQNDVEAARAHLEHCVKAWPLNADSHFLLARACRRLDDMDGWRTHLHRAVLLHWPPRDIELEQQLQAAQTGRLFEVEGALLERVNRFPPEEEIILEALCRGYIADDRLAEGLNLIHEWLRRHPNNWLPWYYQGLAYRAKHGNAKAEADFRHVLELKPDQPDSQIVLAILYAGDGHYRPAARLFERYLERKPNDADALYGLACCQQALGQGAEATTSLRRLLAHHANHAAGLLLQGKRQLAEGNLNDALLSLRQAHALKPNNIEVLQNLSQVLAQLHRPAEAAPYEKRLKQLQQASQQLTLLQGRIQQEPNDVGLRYQAAMLCLKNGWDEESAHWFQTILYIDPNHRATHRALAD